MSPKQSFSPLEWTVQLDQQLRASLVEDVGKGDLTTEAIVPWLLSGRGELIAKSRGLLCGAEVAKRVWRLASKKIRVVWHAREGSQLEPNRVFATLTGPMRGLLVGERVALNFLQRLSGIATLTARFVDLASAAGGPVVCDTRKTVPLWRALERYAVRVGGGTNHRFGLFDMVLIKENHVQAAGSLREAIRRVRATHGRRRVIAEARNVQEVKICCEERVNLVLLDNFTPRRARAVIDRFCSEAIPFEISGGVNLHNIAAYARTGAERISIGALTHSAPSLDISLKLYQKQ